MSDLGAGNQIAHTCNADIAGSELGAALRAVMLLLIKEASKLVELVRFLQQFIRGDVLKFLRAVKFVQYEKALLGAMKQVTGKLVEIVRALRKRLESLQYFDTVKITIAKLGEWEKRFYQVQQDALKQMPKALAELDVRLAKVLAQTSPKETHMAAAGVQANKTVAAIPTKQRIRDTPGRFLAEAENNGPLASTPRSETKPARDSKRKSTAPPEAPKNTPDPVKPPDEGPNTKKQAVADAEAIATREKAARISERIGSDIKNHPLRQRMKRKSQRLNRRHNQWPKQVLIKT